MIEDFIERKHGRKKVEYLVPELAPILKETHGVILYQEQVMKIAQVLGGYSMGAADDLRKAMGKKIKEKMAEHRDYFVTGAVKNNINETRAREIYEQMEYFGGYGFNKSHSAAYALIAYQTAYLKAHFPVEFMAALLTSAMSHPDDVVKFIAECRTAGIAILPPDINESEKRFTVVGGRIRFGLLAVKNVGEAAIEVIVEERQKNGGYVSLFDFCERVSLFKVNKKVVESLIKCGALDSTGAERARMMAAVEDALSYGQTIQRERADAQMTFFDLGDTGKPLNAPVLPDLPEWSEKQRLVFEKEALGFYVTGHPLSNYRDLLARYANADSVTIREMKDKAHVIIGGTITTINRKRTKTDKQMANIVIEDIYGPLRVVVFPDVFKVVADFLVEDAPVFAEGTLEKSESTISLQADRIVPIEKAHEAWRPSVHCTIDADSATRETLSELKKIFDENPGPCNGFLHLISAVGGETVISLPDSTKLSPGMILTDRIDGLLGYKSVRAACQLLPGAEQWGPKKTFRRNGAGGNARRNFG
jgi:DNA polymerase-3 subunit alpha